MLIFFRYQNLFLNLYKCTIPSNTETSPSSSFSLTNCLFYLNNVYFYGCFFLVYFVFYIMFIHINILQLCNFLLQLLLNSSYIYNFFLLWQKYWLIYINNKLQNYLATCVWCFSHVLSMYLSP